MKYKILETGNSSKHNNQNNYQWNIKYQKQVNRRKHNQNNYQWNIKHQKQGTGQNITIKTTTSGI